MYLDRALMFTVPIRTSENADRVTQLGRALREPGIGSILALSPTVVPQVSHPPGVSVATSEARPLFSSFPASPLTT